MPRPLIVALAATIVAWAPPTVFGMRWPDYRATRDFISELGAAGAPDAAVVNVSFLAAGLLFVVACVLVARQKGGGRATVALSLVSLVGVSYIVAAAVPCDAGCPPEGSPTQMLHNGVGGLGYLAAAIGLFLAAGSPFPAPSGPRWLAAASGAIVLASLMGMGAPELGDVRGALQRLGEAAIFTWLLVDAAAVERAHARPRPA